jgi:hypothetical protein
LGLIVGLWTVSRVPIRAVGQYRRRIGRAPIPAQRLTVRDAKGDDPWER